MKPTVQSTVVAGVMCGLAWTAGALAPGEAHGAVTLSFDPPHGIIYQTVLPVPPDTLTVQVKVDAMATDLRGFSFVLAFDPTYVTPVSVEAGPLLAGVACDDFFAWLNPAAATADSIAVDGAGLGCSMTGPGSVVEMKFVGVPGSYGESPLLWREVRLRDSMNDSLAVVCQEGTITHQPIIISTEPSTWARLKSLFR